MAIESVMLNLPRALYEQFRYRAKNNHRTVEAELLDAVTTAASSVEDELPTELEAELEGLVSLDDSALWRAARSRMPVLMAELMAELNYKQQNYRLTKEELNTLNDLGEQYDRYMLIRAKAMVLLKERGHDISEFNPYGRIYS